MTPSVHLRQRLSLLSPVRYVRQIEIVTERLRFLCREVEAWLPCESSPASAMILIFSTIVVDIGAAKTMPRAGLFIFTETSLGSGPIDISVAIRCRLREEIACKRPVLLTDEQMECLRSYILKSHGKLRVDDRRVPSDIPFGNRNGVASHHAPEGMVCTRCFAAAGSGGERTVISTDDGSARRPKRRLEHRHD